MSESLLGNTNSLGYKHTDATKEKLSISNTGIKRNPFSDETKKKMSIAKKGKPGFFTDHRHSEQSKEKMSASHMGKIPGNKNKCYILFTSIQIEDIKTSNLSGRKLAKKYNVSRLVISRIINNYYDNI